MLYICPKKCTMLFLLQKAVTLCLKLDFDLGGDLEEFLAHSANVNCLSIGKKTSRLLITGGDDYKVNLWAIGKPTSLMVSFSIFSNFFVLSKWFCTRKWWCYLLILQSLCGHTSEVDSVAFDSAEVLVLGGASSGLIKLWDLEEAKS